MDLIIWICYTLEDVIEFENLHHVIDYDIYKEDDNFITVMAGYLKTNSPKDES